MRSILREIRDCQKTLKLLVTQSEKCLQEHAREKLEKTRNQKAFLNESRGSINTRIPSNPLAKYYFSRPFIFFAGRTLFSLS